MASSKNMTLVLLMCSVATVSAVTLSWPHKKKKSLPWLSWPDPNYPVMSPREKDFTLIRDSDLMPVFEHARNQRFGKKLVLNNIHGGEWAGGNMGNLIHQPVELLPHATDDATVKACDDIVGAIRDAGIYKSTWQKQQATKVGIPYLTALMQKYADNYNVQRSCFSALGAAVSGNGMLQEQAFLTLDMAPFLVNATRTYKNDPPLLGHILHTVGEMTDLSNRSAHAFMKADGLQAVIAAFKANQDDEDFLGGFYDGMAGLARTNQNVREALFHQGIIVTGLEHIRLYKNRGHMVSKVLSLVGNVARRGRATLKDIERAGYVPEVLSIVKRAGGHKDVTYACVLFLRSLFEAAWAEEDRIKLSHILINRQAVETLVNVLKSDKVVRKGGERTQPVLLRTMELLYILEAYEPITGKLARSVDGHMEVMKMYYSDLKTHNYACAFLKLLVREDEGVEMCVAAQCPQQCGGLEPAELAKRLLQKAERRAAAAKASLEGLEAEAQGVKKKLEALKEGTKQHGKVQGQSVDIATKVASAKTAYEDAMRELESLRPKETTAAPTQDADSDAEEKGILEDEEDDEEVPDLAGGDLEAASKD